jgi:hypothetical protein
MISKYFWEPIVWEMSEFKKGGGAEEDAADYLCDYFDKTLYYEQEEIRELVSDRWEEL